MKSEQLEVARELVKGQEVSHGLNFVSIPTGFRSAVVDACLLQCEGKLIVVVVNPLKVFMLAGVPLRGTHGLLM